MSTITPPASEEKACRFGIRREKAKVDSDVRTTIRFVPAPARRRILSAVKLTVSSGSDTAFAKNLPPAAVYYASSDRRGEHPGSIWPPSVVSCKPIATTPSNRCSTRRRGCGRLRRRFALPMRGETSSSWLTSRKMLGGGYCHLPSKMRQELPSILTPHRKPTPTLTTSGSSFTDDYLHLPSQTDSVAA